MSFLPELPAGERQLYGADRELMYSHTLRTTDVIVAAVMRPGSLSVTMETGTPM